jgi:TusA-related sulfurtransferase
VANNKLDLQAHRCPTAMLMARRAIDTFNNEASAGDMLYIQTIEPSFSRDLDQYINAEHEDISITKKVSGEISKASIDAWRDDFDESDWIGVKQSCYVLCYMPT